MSETFNLAFRGARVTPAERQRARRRRQRHGRRVLAVEVDLAHVEAMLAGSGHLPPYGADDPDVIRRALEQAIEDMAIVRVD